MADGAAKPIAVVPFPKNTPLSVNDPIPVPPLATEIVVAFHVPELIVPNVVIVPCPA